MSTSRFPRRTILSTLAMGIGGIVVVCAVGGCSGAAPAQRRNDLYACEGCEAVAERDPTGLPAHLVLAPADEPGDRLRLSGRVLGADGNPVAGVVVYAHHTNAAGLYAGGAPDTEWSRRHGRLRGWVKTGPDGRYSFDTIKPAPYPNDTMPAHIHLFLGEPGRRPYYIDDVVFAGEFGVTEAYRKAQELRGGSGIVQLVRTDAGVWLAERDIVLELHPD